MAALTSERGPRERPRQRRQMTADIAHELRTPLSLILGHPRRSPTACWSKQETFDVIYDEARRHPPGRRPARLPPMQAAGDAASRRPGGALALRRRARRRRRGALRQLTWRWTPTSPTTWTPSHHQVAQARQRPALHPPGRITLSAGGGFRGARACRMQPGDRRGGPDVFERFTAPIPPGAGGNSGWGAMPAPSPTAWRRIWQAPRLRGDILMDLRRGRRLMAPPAPTARTRLVLPLLAYNAPQRSPRRTTHEPQLPCL